MEKNLIEINPTVVEQSVTYYGQIELNFVYKFRVKKTISDAGVEYEVDRVEYAYTDDADLEGEIKKEVIWLIQDTIERYCNKHPLK
jgi:hypothetical protein